jgi:adenine C2-methylase RlmN of 23S rRNA A2503 and tRNA A37
VNDSLECAEQLGELLSTRSVMLNLIPYNDTTEVIVNKAFKAPSFDAVDAFQAVVVSKEGRMGYAST